MPTDAQIIEELYSRIEALEAQAATRDFIGEVATVSDDQTTLTVRRTADGETANVDGVVNTLVEIAGGNYRNVKLRVRSTETNPLTGEQSTVPGDHVLVTWVDNTPFAVRLVPTSANWDDAVNATVETSVSGPGGTVMPGSVVNAGIISLATDATEGNIIGTLNTATDTKAVTIYDDESIVHKADGSMIAQVEGTIALVAANEIATLIGDTVILSGSSRASLFSEERVSVYAGDPALPNADASLSLAVSPITIIQLSAREPLDQTQYPGGYISTALTLRPDHINVIKVRVEDPSMPADGSGDPSNPNTLQGDTLI